MKKYSEQHLQKVIQEQLFSDPSLSDDVANFSFNHPIIGYLKKDDLEKRQLNGMFDADEDGILAVLISGVGKYKVQEHFYFSFADLQGIRIKERKFSYIITLRYTSGLNYVFQLFKRKTKRFPNQDAHLSHFLSILEKQELHQMDNKRYQKRFAQDKLYALIYIVTLLAFEAGVVAIFFRSDPDRNLVFGIVLLIVMILVALLHLILLVIATMSFDKWRNRKFASEFNWIMKEYNKTGDYEELLDSLRNMQHRPRGEQAKNTFFLTEAQALYKTGRTDEALACLDELEISSKRAHDAVEKQRQMIKGETDEHSPQSH